MGPKESKKEFTIVTNPDGILWGTKDMDIPIANDIKDLIERLKIIQEFDPDAQIVQIIRLKSYQ